MAKTALDLTPEEWQRYDPTQNLGKLHDADRWERAWQLVPQLATLLREQFGATRVVVFGSLTHPESYTRWSDIDLAAWGIPPAKFFKAVAVVTGISEEFEVDLVDPEICHSRLRQVIEQKGIEV